MQHRYARKISILEFFEGHPNAPASMCAAAIDLDVKTASTECARYYHRRYLKGIKGFDLAGNPCRIYSLSAQGESWLAWARVMVSHINSLETDQDRQISQLSAFKEYPF